MRKKLKAISLFSGAMGLDLGLEKAGFDVLACVENDKHCIETITNNRPAVKLYNDISSVDPQDVLKDLGLVSGSVDLVAGGPPCQAFSTAGRRRSLDDFRGNLIIRYLEFISEIKPKYFILENVRGLLSAKLANTPPEYGDYSSVEDTPGSVIWFLTEEFKKLGYKISFSLFDASLYGVPQRRERVIIFGTLGDEEIEIPQPTTALNLKTVRDAIGDIQSIKHDYLPLGKKQTEYLSLLKAGQYWKHLPEHLQEEAMGKSFLLGGGKTGFYRRLSWDKPSPTLVTHPTMPATLLAHPELMRPLSIQEYARIQMFPDDWKFSGKLTDIYKQIGNAVPVGLGLMAGTAIVNHKKRTQKKASAQKTSRYNRTSHKEFLSDFRNANIKKPQPALF
ncbi:MAG: DNA cytosine methyltransferase [Gaiellales bacterium]|nr:MAG: DNA cytosine methyltransferase [Gaiellales bacterium]